MSRAGDENLRERIPDGQQRRELPLERRFGADVVTYLDVDELRPPLRDEVDLLLVQLPDVGSLASSTPGRPRSRTCGPSPCRASPGPHSAFPSRIRNAVNRFLETLAQLHLVDEEAVAGALFVPLL